ncbi:PDCL family protein [Megaselia abdita]
MATLEDKLSGEKLQYYCSSSEDEEESNNAVAESNQNTVKKSHRTTSNTGPKGVVQDWQLYKQLEEQNRDENEKQKIALARKFCLNASSTREDEERKLNEEFDAEFSELMSEEFLMRFQKQRIAEMMKISGHVTKFGKVLTLNSSDEFLDAVDKEDHTITVVIHIFDTKYSACKKVNEFLEPIAADYNTIKFCKINSGVAGMSRNFNANGLPALLVYKGKELIGNHVRLTDELSDDFFQSDLESFLIENNVMIDKSLYQ